MCFALGKVTVQKNATFFVAFCWRQSQKVLIFFKRMQSLGVSSLCSAANRYRSYQLAYNKAKHVYYAFKNKQNTENKCEIIIAQKINN